MKARVIIDLEFKDGEQPKFTVAGLWLDGNAIKGQLEPMQVLAAMESAKALLMSGVPFTPPSLVKLATPASLSRLNGVQ